MEKIKSISVELSNKIDEIINSKVQNETFLLVESLFILNELNDLINEEREERIKNQLNIKNL